MTLTQEKVRHLFSYDALTGDLVWKNPSGNRVRKGDIAGFIKQAYRKVQYNGKVYRIHRLVWLYVYGYFPEQHIDHIDRNGLNNRLGNLREVSRRCNMRNTGNSRTNTSGVKGVSWESNRQLWRVQIATQRKNISVGLRKDFCEAVCLRFAAEQCLNWSSCDANSPAHRYMKRHSLVSEGD